MLKLNRLLLTSGGTECVNAVADLFTSIQVEIVDAQRLLGDTFDDATWMFIDWLLPTMAGIQLVRLIREAGIARRARISMVLPRVDEAMQMRALDAGADDYMIGPISPAALVDRMRSYRANIASPDNARARLGDLMIDNDAYCARYAGQIIELKVSELRLLEHFVRHPDRVFSRSALIGVMGRSWSVHDERTVDAWMSRLRTKLKRHGVPFEIRTVRTFGYILDTA